MSRIVSNEKAAESPAPLQIGAIRAGLALAIAASLLAFAVRAQAQQPGGSTISIHPVVSSVK